MPGRKDDLSEKPMSRHDALQVVKRRWATANLPVDIRCRSFRGSAITLYLQRGGTSNAPRKSPALPMRGQPGQHLAALRVFFDWLVTGHIVESNPAASVRGPKLVVREGKNPGPAGGGASAAL